MQIEAEAMNVTQAMIDAVRQRVPVTELVAREAAQAALDVIDPVPAEVRMIVDGSGDEYYRASDTSVWRAECGCCYFTVPELIDRWGPITWEGKA